MNLKADICGGRWSTRDPCPDPEKSSRQIYPLYNWTSQILQPTRKGKSLKLVFLFLTKMLRCLVDGEFNSEKALQLTPVANIMYWYLHISNWLWEGKNITQWKEFSSGAATLKMNHFPQFSKTCYWTVIAPLKSRKSARWQGLKLFDEVSSSALFPDQWGAASFPKATHF